MNITVTVPLNAGHFGDNRHSRWSQLPPATAQET